LKGLGDATVEKDPGATRRVVMKHHALVRVAHWRLAYLSMPLLGQLAVASGWAMHKPARRRKEVASSVATTLRLFQRLSASRIPGGRSWGAPLGLLRSCAAI